MSALSRHLRWLLTGVVLLSCAPEDPDDGQDAPDELANMAPSHQAQFYIQSEIEQRVLDIAGAGTEPGTAVHLWDFHGEDWQKWYTNDLGGGYWNIQSAMAPHMVLDVHSLTPEPRVPVGMWPWNEGQNQRWALEPVGDGYYHIRSALGLYLDVKRSSSEIGTPLWTWPFNGGRAQRFRLMRTDMVTTSLDVMFQTGNDSLRCDGEAYLTLHTKHGSSREYELTRSGTEDWARDMRNIELDAPLYLCDLNHVSVRYVSDKCQDWDSHDNWNLREFSVSAGGHTVARRNPPAHLFTAHSSVFRINASLPQCAVPAPDALSELSVFLRTGDDGLRCKGRAYLNVHTKQGDLVDLPITDGEQLVKFSEHRRKITLPRAVSRSDILGFSIRHTSAVCGIGPGWGTDKWPVQHIRIDDPSGVALAEVTGVPHAAVFRGDTVEVKLGPNLHSGYVCKTRPVCAWNKTVAVWSCTDDEARRIGGGTLGVCSGCGGTDQPCCDGGFCTLGQGVCSEGTCRNVICTEGRPHWQEWYCDDTKTGYYGAGCSPKQAEERAKFRHQNCSDWDQIASF